MTDTFRLRCHDRQTSRCSRKKTRICLRIRHLRNFLARMWMVPKHAPADCLPSTARRWWSWIIFYDNGHISRSQPACNDARNILDSRRRGRCCRRDWPDTRWCVDDGRNLEMDILAQVSRGLTSQIQKECNADGNTLVAHVLSYPCLLSFSCGQKTFTHQTLQVLLYAALIS